MEEFVYHKPVLVDEVIEGLQVKPHGVYLDVTFGGGGHSSALLDSDPTVSVVALDWDQHAIENAQPLIEKYEGRLKVVWGSFAHLYRLAKKHKFPQFDGILADFGTSQFQIHHEDGFSVYNDTALDMRMSHSHFKVKASDIVNYASEQELREIFWKYGEERNTKRIAAGICLRRKKKLFKTTKDLAEHIASIVKVERKKNSKTVIHPATRVFQALRIVVNKEIENIIAFLKNALPHLKLHGRLACISFHSLEDREVKNYFREQEQKLKGSVITKKVVVPSKEEISRNAASRSSKLRIFEKK